MDEYLRVVAKGSDYMNENDVSRVFDEYEPLKCVWCHKDLLKDNLGNVVLVRSFFTSSSAWKVVAVHAVCNNGKCDRAASAAWKNLGCSISSVDLMNLLEFMRWDVAHTIELYGKENFRKYYSPTAFILLRWMMLRISQKALRQPTTSEWDKALEVHQWWRDIGSPFDEEDLELEDFALFDITILLHLTRAARLAPKGLDGIR
jgi:hypothetical protein